MFTAWEKGYAYDCFMSGMPLSGICGSIKHRTKKQYDEDQIQQMIIQHIRENLENE